LLCVGHMQSSWRMCDVRDLTTVITSLAHHCMRVAIYALSADLVLVALGPVHDVTLYRRARDL